MPATGAGCGSLRGPYLTGGELPPAGKFNAGQKINARLVLLVARGALRLGRSESLAARPPCSRRCASSAAPHGLAAGIAAVLVAGHIYLALIHPATRPALRGITRGSVRRDWAEHHHAEWVAAIDARRE